MKCESCETQLTELKPGVYTCLNEKCRLYGYMQMEGEDE